MVKTQSSTGVEELLRAAEILDNWDREREHGYAAAAPRSDNQDGGDVVKCEPSSSNTTLSSTSSSNARGLSNSTIKPNTRRRRHSASGSSSSGRRHSTSSSSPDHKSKGSGKESVHNGHVRSAHNELEKSRRASMRHCLEALRHLLPTDHLERTSTGKNTTLSVLRSARSFIKALHDCLEQKSETKNQLMCEQSKKLHRLSLLTSSSSATTTGSTCANNLETLGTAAMLAATAVVASSESSSCVPASSSSNIGSSVLTASVAGNANTNAFDGSPPISVVKTGSSVMAFKSIEKARSISESSTINLIPQGRKMEIEIKRKNGDALSESGDFHDIYPARVVFVSPVNDGDEHSVLSPNSNAPRIVAATLRR